VWNDSDVIAFLKEGTLPDNREQAKRVHRRSLSYRWYNNRLYFTRTRMGSPDTYRQVPPPEDAGTNSFFKPTQNSDTWVKSDVSQQCPPPIGGTE
jgi:hypothetical protein